MPSLPNAQWPGNARACISFVVNYEEGGENTILNGDCASEAYLTEYGAPTGPPPSGLRNLSVESSYEYGSRRGFWRILGLFEKFNYPFTSWAVGKAVELNPAAVKAMEEAGCEVASHSYRWINYVTMSEDEERSHINKAIDAISEASLKNQPPLGWYTGRQSLNTRRFVYEEYKKRNLHHLLYDSDAYDDDLPYYVPAPDGTEGEYLLVVPYTLDVNDMKFANTPGFFNSDSFYQYMVDALETIISEADEAPRMMTVGLHCRIVGRPGRFPAIRKFLEYVQARNKELEQTGGGIWVATRNQIAEHWRATHPPPK
ncbi:hypothetical protein MCUN1_003456 [Malassezia cuniculi]|uniref:NodB homology domain-containing protein n=1 Tax=Malassezia cuniculi TaxID=948313 RepID=A0AAF0ET69_9BASI|nr:hypothetical protein MCUN1_003456 [Malassezia cuniculi]